MSDGVAFTLARDARETKRARDQVESTVSTCFHQLKQKYANNREVSDTVTRLETQCDLTTACLFLFNYEILSTPKVATPERTQVVLDNAVALRFKALKREYFEDTEISNTLERLEKEQGQEAACLFLFNHALHQETVIGLRHSFSAQDAKQDIKARDLLLEERNTQIARLMELTQDAPKLRKRNEELEELLIQSTRKTVALEQRVQHQATQLAAAHQGRMQKARDDALSAVNTHVLAIYNAMQAPNSDKDSILSAIVEHTDAIRSTVGSILI